MTDEKPADGVDPEEFLRALLQISPEDAKESRDVAAKKSAKPDAP